MHIIIVTGLSGAGRSTTLHVLEDFGFYCVDNLPPRLAPALVETLASQGEVGRLALGVDVRTGSFFNQVPQVLDELEQAGHRVEILFLDSRSDVLVRRFSETRRPHLLATAGDIHAAIRQERERLASLRARATYLIDTSELNVHELRRKLAEYTAKGQKPRMLVRLISFGFKYGLPNDADLVFDLRALPNPHFVPSLQPKTGEDDDVAEFVLKAPETQELLQDVEQLLKRHIPRYEREGKAYLTIALGCTGGRHRSVALVRELARRLGSDRDIVIADRDVHLPTRKQR